MTTNDQNKKKIIFWGTPDFSLPCLEVLAEANLVSAVITQPDKPAGRKRELKSSPVKIYAMRNNITVLQPINFDQTFITALEKFLPATFVIVAYGKLIPQLVLDRSELPAVNIHPSCLPELRGPSPIQTALLKGLTSTAVSLMQLDAKMDHGPILGQVEVAVHPEDDYYTLSDRLAKIAAGLITEKINNYLSGKITPVAQDDKLATYCKLIKKSDGEIDWTKAAEEINNQIRAFVFWPGSFTKLDDIYLKIIKVCVSQEKISPGRFEVKSEKLYVGTATQALEIIRLQPAGKKIMSSQEFIRGYQKYLD